MKMRTLVGMTVLAVAVAGFARTASAQAVWTGQGSHLLRRGYTLAANEQIQFQTTGCTSGSGKDTVIFLLEGSGNTRTTAAWNDDQGSGFTEPYCSYIFFTNNTGSTKTYETVTTIYPGTASAAVTYRVWRASTGWVDEAVTVNGLTAKYWQSGTVTHESMGLRSGAGGGFVDTVLFLIDTNVGSTSNFNDDDGLQYLSKMSVNMPCSSSTWNCWTVSGNYSFGSTAVNYDVWLLAGADTDGDSIPDGIESTKGTATNGVDTDADGLTDPEEFLGVKQASLSGLEGSLVMPWQDTGADPTVDDLFIEVDYMTAAGHDHNPSGAANWNTFVNDMVGIFQNDNAFTARVVRPHVMVSQSMTETSHISLGNCSNSGTTKFYDRKGSTSWFDPLRATIFHYIIVGHDRRSVDCASTGGSGEGEIWGNDAIVTLGSFTNSVGTVNDQRGTFIHELGHNLALVHNSNGNNPLNTGPNSCVHSSVMNYRYQVSSWAGGTIPALRGWGYSNGACPTSGNGCANTCTGGCVPSAQTSPKTGCSPNNGSCDCDRSEWANLNLDIPSNGSMTFVGCQIGNCAGGSHESRADLRDFFIGDRGRLRPAHRAWAQKRKEKLIELGLVAGRDFVEDPDTGRLYSE
jgi:hypothetical protein